jgi:hypothetical protein
MRTKTDVREETQVREQPKLADGDSERFAHIVRGRDKVTEAYVLGKPVVALCGKRWVPTRDPKRYPVCPTCKEIAAASRPSV